MSDFLQEKCFEHRHEAIEADVVSYTFLRYVHVCAQRFQETTTFGGVDIPEGMQPVIVLFTSVPSSVNVPNGICRCMVVGTSSAELDAFFASQYTMLQTCLAVHSHTLHFAAMSCQHSAVKYILVKLSLLGHCSRVHLSLLKSVDGRNAEHVLAMSNTLIKTIPLGSAPRLRDVERLLTLRMRVDSDADFERIVHVWELSLRVTQASTNLSISHKLSGSVKLPSFLNYSFFQICIPKEVFLDRPHLRTLFGSFASIAAPVPFIGVKPENSKEFFCFAASLAGLQHSSYAHLVQELEEVVFECRTQHMLFAYALHYQSDSTADDMYVRLDTSNYPHILEHCLTFPCIQLDYTTFLLRMRPLEFERWHQSCLSEQLPHPHSVSTGVSAIQVRTHQTLTSIEFLSEPGGIRSAVFQLRPLQGCPAALQTSFRANPLVICTRALA